MDIEEKRRKARERQAKYYKENKESINLKRKKPIYTNTYIIDKLEVYPWTSVSTKKFNLDTLKTILKIIENRSLFESLKKPKQLIESIDLAKYKGETLYGINTKKGFFQTILKIIDTVNIPVDKTLFVDEFNKYKILSYESKEKQQEKEIPTFNEYLEKAKELFGENSKEYIMSVLYSEITLRDDFYLKIIKDKREETDPLINYLLINKNGMTVIINEYKTNNVYEKMVRELSPYLTGLLRKYIKPNWDYLFDKNNANFVSRMNGALGYRDLGLGAINLFRKMKKTDLEHDNETTIMDRVGLAKKMGHSVNTSRKYQQGKKKDCMQLCGCSGAAGVEKTSIVGRVGSGFY
jgi:hypothetical protein